jgi:hypothetical protein
MSQAALNGTRGSSDDRPSHWYDLRTLKTHVWGERLGLPTKLRVVLRAVLECRVEMAMAMITNWFGAGSASNHEAIPVVLELLLAIVRERLDCSEMGESTADVYTTLVHNVVALPAVVSTPVYKQQYERSLALEARVSTIRELLALLTHGMVSKPRTMLIDDHQPPSKKVSEPKRDENDDDDDDEVQLEKDAVLHATLRMRETQLMNENVHLQHGATRA